MKNDFTNDLSLEDIINYENLLKTEPEEYWIEKGESMALGLFRQMSKRVPAYKDFLKTNNVDPSLINTIADFKNVPTLDKDNYLRKYPRESLFFDSKFSDKQWIISTTSGSTGEPYYFPRNHKQDLQYALSAELYLRSNFQIQNLKTLYIVAFPMGAWIGGLFTYEALKIIASRSNYSLSIITTGIHKQEIISAVKQMGKDFDQIIIGSYAPFLKDVIDDGYREGINWKDYKLGFIFSAEAFTEKFRDFVLDSTNTTDELKSTLNHYGTVDLGTMAHETPESIFIRRELVKSNRLNMIFPEKHRQPTFSQYNPEQFYFEEVDNNLICSSYSGIPLVRYDLKDYGGLIKRDDLHKNLLKNNIDVNKAAIKTNIVESFKNLPFVFIYERNDFSVSYYAFQIYPDTIRRALQSIQLSAVLTGKFTMKVEYNDEGRQELIIHIELKHAVEMTLDLNKTVKEHIHDLLINESSEYRETFKMIGDPTIPIVYLWQYEETEYFRPGTKQRWVIK